MSSILCMRWYVPSRQNQITVYFHTLMRKENICLSKPKIFSRRSNISSLSYYIPSQHNYIFWLLSLIGIYHHHRLVILLFEYLLMYYLGFFVSLYFLFWIFRKKERKKERERKNSSSISNKHTRGIGDRWMKERKNDTYTQLESFSVCMSWIF